MFKNILLRSVAGATALGSALTISLVATPAVVTSAPDIQNVACTVQYPSSVSTSTGVSLAKKFAVYGARNSATASVARTDGSSKTPGGSVRFILSKQGGSVIQRWTASLSGGQATVFLPRRLPARSAYSVTARYLPPGCTIYKPSSGSNGFSVFPGTTATGVNAPNIRRGQIARARVTVTSDSPFTATGRVTVVLSRRGNQLASKTYTLDSGSVTASFGRRRVGTYTVTAYYKGTNNYKQSQGADDFRVRR